MSKENKIGKEPLKSLISKVGTFRGKKNGRASTTDLKYLDSIPDDSILHGIGEGSPADTTTADLDTTTKSYCTNNSNYVHRLVFNYGC
jgi:hypothetical protein